MTVIAKFSYYYQRNGKNFGIRQDYAQFFQALGFQTAPKWRFAAHKNKKTLEMQLWAGKGVPGDKLEYHKDLFLNWWKENISQSIVPDYLRMVGYIVIALDERHLVALDNSNDRLELDVLDGKKDNGAFLMMFSDSKMPVKKQPIEAPLTIHPQQAIAPAPARSVEEEKEPGITFNILKDQQNFVFNLMVHLIQNSSATKVFGKFTILEQPPTFTLSLYTTDNGTRDFSWSRTTAGDPWKKTWLVDLANFPQGFDKWFSDLVNCINNPIPAPSDVPTATETAPARKPTLRVEQEDIREQKFDEVDEDHKLLQAFLPVYTQLLNPSKLYKNKSQLDKGIKAKEYRKDEGQHKFMTSKKISEVIIHSLEKYNRTRKACVDLEWMDAEANALATAPHRVQNLILDYRAKKNFVELYLNTKDKPHSIFSPLYRFSKSTKSSLKKDAWHGEWSEILGEVLREDKVKTLNVLGGLGWLNDHVWTGLAPEAVIKFMDDGKAVAGSMGLRPASGD